MMTENPDLNKLGIARFKNAGILCMLCIVVNIVGAQLALALKVPVFPDSLGTIVAAMLGELSAELEANETYMLNLLFQLRVSVALLLCVVMVKLAGAALPEPIIRACCPFGGKAGTDRQFNSFNDLQRADGPNAVAVDSEPPRTTRVQGGTKWGSCTGTRGFPRKSRTSIGSLTP